MSTDLPPGAPRAAHDEERLADLLALADGSVWTYSAGVGGFVALAGEHEGVVCRNAAAVIEHTGGNVRPAQPHEYPDGYGPEVTS